MQPAAIPMISRARRNFSALDSAPTALLCLDQGGQEMQQLRTRGQGTEFTNCTHPRVLKRPVRFGESQSQIFENPNES
jgi:hypothetical protein